MDKTENKCLSVKETGTGCNEEGSTFPISPPESKTHANADGALPEHVREKPHESWYGKIDRLLRSMTDEVTDFVGSQPQATVTLEYPVTMHIEDENGDLHILKARTARHNPWRNTLELFSDKFDMEKLKTEDKRQEWKEHATLEESWETCEPPQSDLTASYNAVRTEDLILLADTILSGQ